VAGEWILLVEDNDVLREGLKSVLEQEGYHAMVAGDGKEALAKMEKTTPDLVLSDIIMPELDGYGLFDVIRSRAEWVSIPFIFLTARRERQYVLAGKRLGADDYLLNQSLRMIIDRHSPGWGVANIALGSNSESYETSLIMLANAIEVRDPYTRGHVERVMNYALSIAEELGWTPSNLTNLRFGSILHDIGKIHISEQILRKRGSLTEEEWVEIRKHPENGAELIKAIPFLEHAIPIILYHHERWNGSGYPYGLKEMAIPVAARIVAIADSFDAMTTMRPYREVLSPEHAYREIETNAGILFDPAMVRAFQRIWLTKKVQAIFEAFPEV
jgi:putative two-component system response regulator